MQRISGAGFSNETIKNRIFDILVEFVDQVDPHGCLMTNLIAERVVGVDTRKRLLNDVISAKKTQCLELMCQLLKSTQPKAFVIVRIEALVEDYPWIVEKMDGLCSLTSRSGFAYIYLIANCQAIN